MGRRGASGGAADRTLLSGGLVYTGGAVERAEVVVEGDRIAAVDRAPPADRAAVRDCRGLLLVPGIVDCHVHVQFSTPAAILAGGVTTVRDLGGPPTAALSSAGATPLRILAAGRILTAPGGYPSRSWGADGTAREVRGLADAAAAVGEQARAGAVVVKVALEPAAGPVLPEAVLRRIVEAAAELDLAVTAHVRGRRELALALDAGVAELAHLPLHDVTAEEMVAAARAGVALVPTLQIRGPGSSGSSAVAAFREAGGVVVYGSDLGNDGTSPGVSVREVRALLDSGMGLFDVLDAATASAANHLGLPGVGRIAPGWRADVLAVDAALASGAVSALADVRLVLAGGVPVVDRL